MRGLITLIGLAAVCVGVFALGMLRSEDDDKPLLHVADELPIKVHTAAPERREVIKIVQAPGDVEPELEVDISSEIVAKIVEMPIEEGDTVKTGDLLCRLDDKNLQAEVESGNVAVARLKAGVVQAEADFEKADRDMKRLIRLSETDSTTVLELADYRTTLKKAAAVLDMRKQELAEAEALLKRVHEDLKRTIIDSPIDGVVAKLNAKQGEVVVTGTMNNPGTVIMTISDLGKMQVRARVDEIDVPKVKAGQNARIYLQADQQKPVLAQVVRVASKGTRVTGRDVVTFETILEVLPSEQEVKPGMTANVEIEVAKHDDVVTVPLEAIVHRLRKDLADHIVEEFDRKQASLDLSERARQAQYIKVLYVKDNDIARIRLVETGIADSKRVELVDGVVQEDEIIIGPYRSLDELKDGKQVALIEDEKKEGTLDDDSDHTEEQSAQGEPEPETAEDG